MSVEFTRSAVGKQLATRREETSKTVEWAVAMVKGR